MGSRRLIDIFIKAAVINSLTAITSTRGTVSTFTVKLDVLRTTRSTVSTKFAVPVILAFKRKGTFVSKDTMSTDLFTYRRFIFTKSISDSLFRRTVRNASSDDVSFFKRKMFVLFIDDMMNTPLRIRKRKATVKSIINL